VHHSIAMAEEVITWAMIGQDVLAGIISWAAGKLLSDIFNKPDRDMADVVKELVKNIGGIVHQEIQENVRKELFGDVFSLQDLMKQYCLLTRPAERLDRLHTAYPIAVRVVARIQQYNGQESLPLHHSFVLAAGLQILIHQALLKETGDEGEKNILLLFIDRNKPMLEDFKKEWKIWSDTRFGDPFADMFRDHFVHWKFRPKDGVEEERKSKKQYRVVRDPDGGGRIEPVSYKKCLLDYEADKTAEFKKLWADTKLVLSDQLFTTMDTVKSDILRSRNLNSILSKL